MRQLWRRVAYLGMLLCCLGVLNVYAKPESRFVVYLYADVGVGTDGQILNENLPDYRSSPPKPAKTGETMSIPVVIYRAPEWKRMRVTFERDEDSAKDPQAVNAGTVKFGTVTLDSTQQAPVVVKVPLVVTGDISQRYRPVVHVDLPDGVITEWGTNDTGGAGNSIGIFSFEGYVGVDPAFGTDAYVTLFKNKIQSTADPNSRYEFYERYREKYPVKKH